MLTVLKANVCVNLIDSNCFADTKPIYEFYLV